MDYVINVSNCRAAVSRKELTASGYRIRHADNWQDLERAAQKAIEKQGGAINISGIYPCPDNLARRATFA